MELKIFILAVESVFRNKLLCNQFGIISKNQASPYPVSSAFSFLELF